MDIIKKIVESEEYKEYIKTSKDLKKYYRIDCCEPPALTKKFKVASINYRNFLDDLNIKMPHPKYPFKINDKKTWKFLDCKVHGHSYTGAIINPNWIYKDKA